MAVFLYAPSTDEDKSYGCARVEYIKSNGQVKHWNKKIIEE